MSRVAKLKEKNKIERTIQTLLNQSKKTNLDFDYLVQLQKKLILLEA